MLENKESDSGGNIAGWIIGSVVIFAFILFIVFVPN